MQPYTVRCKVPYTVTENVPCVVSKQVKVCVPETVCVKKARLVPVTVSNDPGCGPDKACHDKGCGDQGCGDKCRGRLFGRGGKDCCDSNACLDGLRQRWFASLCSTGCCEQTCKTPRTPACKTTCNDCHDFCREGLLQRLMRNRFACETDCCTPGAAPAPKAMPPAGTSENIDTLPRALPKN
jgi:hypothetical protein